MTLAVAPGPLVGPVMRRVVGILAARADMPMDRVDDVILMAEAIAQAASRHVVEDRLAVTMRDGDGSLTLEFGPLDPATSGETLESAGTNGGSSRAEIRSGEGGDYVVLTVDAGSVQ
jgi:serine/threonine-protein kinase RsbW